MRKLILTALLIGALLVAASAGTASAATKWPARCTNFKCVNAHLNALHTQAVAAKKTTANVIGFLNCLDFWPTTQYPGYLVSGGSTTALDFTASGDSIDTWVAGIDAGVCGAGTIAARPVAVPFRSFYHR